MTYFLGYRLWIARCIYPLQRGLAKNENENEICGREEYVEMHHRGRGTHGWTSRLGDKGKIYVGTHENKYE